jgi:hypothetical protein
MDSAERAGREAAECCAVVAGPRYRKISQIAKTITNAQGDSSNFEMKTTIHLRASNFGSGRLKDRRNLRARV